MAVNELLCSLKGTSIEFGEIFECKDRKNFSRSVVIRSVRFGVKSVMSYGSWDKDVDEVK